MLLYFHISLFSCYCVTIFQFDKDTGPKNPHFSQMWTEQLKLHTTIPSQVRLEIKEKRRKKKRNDKIRKIKEEKRNDKI